MPVRETRFFKMNTCRIVKGKTQENGAAISCNGLENLENGAGDANLGLGSSTNGMGESQLRLVLTGRLWWRGHHKCTIVLKCN